MGKIERKFDVVVVIVAVEPYQLEKERFCPEKHDRLFG